jgi:flagellar hook-associated protein 1
MTLADESALQASDYTLEPDGSSPGQYLLTRRSDGLVRSIADGDTVDGVTFTLAGIAAGDRFLLQPVSRAAVDMRRALDDPRGLAAASPLAAERGGTNTGSATVASLRVVDPAVDPEQTATIRFYSDTGAYDWELRDRTSNTLLSSGSGAWQPGEPIVLNGFELSLAGVPAIDDEFTVSKTAYPAANNGNALGFAALRDDAFIGGETITDAYASAMADIGVRVQGAATAADVSSAVALQARERVSGETGVNLDEEAARLIQFQQSYQAAAKVLQVAQSVFDTLLQTAGR